MTPHVPSAPITLHRPRHRSGRLGFGLAVQGRVLPPTHHCSQPQLDRLRRRAQMVREGVMTSLLTLLLTSVAVAAPATLQQSPLKTIGSIQQLWMPMGKGQASSLLPDCP